MLSSISTLCYVMAAFTFGVLAGHHLTKDHFMKEKIRNIRKEYE